jgi:hypothetical protein
LNTSGIILLKYGEEIGLKNRTEGILLSLASQNLVIGRSAA